MQVVAIRWTAASADTSTAHPGQNRGDAGQQTGHVLLVTASLVRKTIGWAVPVVEVIVATELPSLLFH
jgi:hypothetical protein